VHELRYRDFDENEEATKITRLVSLRISYLKVCIVVPFLALCTGLFFLLFLHWMPKLRKAFFYTECSLREATHLFIEGTGK